MEPRRPAPAFPGELGLLPVVAALLQDTAGGMARRLLEGLCSDLVLSDESRLL